MRGKASLTCWSSRPPRDHPRVCGEKSTAPLQSLPARGSPPRMRGKDFLKPSELTVNGITPAYAGKSVYRSGLHRTEGDHPRVCGEKKRNNVHFRIISGSPPRMRGKGANFNVSRYSKRITPAYAGKRCLPAKARTMKRITPAYAGKRHGGGMYPSGGQDHPRVCGEKLRP